MNMQNEKLIKIAVLENIFEYDVLSQVLKDQGIVAVFRSYEDTVYGGLFQSQRGWGSIWAEKKDEEKILSLLEEIRTPQVPEMETDDGMDEEALKTFDA